MIEDLKEIGIKEENIFENISMKKYTTFKIGGNAEILVKIKKIEDLEKILKFAKNKNIPLTVIGNGSNILVKDNGIKGITLKIEIDKIEINNLKTNNLEIENLEIKKLGTNNEKVKITVGAGTKLGLLASKLYNYEISGFEELSGIPRKYWWSSKNECRCSW